MPAIPLQFPRLGRPLGLLSLALLFGLASCHPAKRPPAQSEIFAKLSPAKQEELVGALSQDDLDNFDQIVQQACQTNPFANCVCCAPATLAACNANNWDCCASVVFAPGDGGECAFAPPGLCLCQAPG
jgi:hypothetical protein